jgi:hypothetical protein
MPDGQTPLLVVTIAVSLGFDFTDVFHDTAHGVATSISIKSAALLAADRLSTHPAVLERSRRGPVVPGDAGRDDQAGEGGDCEEEARSVVRIQVQRTCL